MATKIDQRGELRLTKWQRLDLNQRPRAYEGQSRIII
jgi:hypothetical protein